jgi:hypothetical protein
VWSVEHRHHDPDPASAEASQLAWPRSDRNRPGARPIRSWAADWPAL